MDDSDAQALKMESEDKDDMVNEGAGAALKEHEESEEENDILGLAKTEEEELDEMENEDTDLEGDVSFLDGHSNSELGRDNLESGNGYSEVVDPLQELDDEDTDVGDDSQEAEGDNLEFDDAETDVGGEMYRVETNPDFIDEDFSGKDGSGNDEEDPGMEGSDFDEGEHPELGMEDEEFIEGDYPEMEDEDSQFEREGNEEGAESTPLELLKQATEEILVTGRDKISSEIGQTDSPVSQSGEGTSVHDINITNVQHISPKIEPTDDLAPGEASHPSFDAESAVSVSKSRDVASSLGTLDWSSSISRASPSKRDLSSPTPCDDRGENPRPNKRLKMQSMRTELDLKGHVMTRTWTELTNLLTEYQAELYQREETLSSFETGNEKEILEEMSTLRDELGSKDKLLSKCQGELSAKTERLKTVEAELIVKTDELNKVKQEFMTKTNQIKKFEFDIRYLKNEHTVKDNLLKKVQDQMVRETREMAAQIQSLRESLEMEKRLAQSYKDVMEREVKKRENAENRCRLVMSQSGGKASASVGSSKVSDVIVIEDDEPHQTSIRSDLFQSRGLSTATSLGSLRQTTPSSSLSSLGQLSSSSGVRRQSPVSSVHGSSIGGAQTSFVSGNSPAKTLSTSSFLQDSSRVASIDTKAPVIANVESLSGGPSGHSLGSGSLMSPSSYDDSIMNPLRKTPERQDSFGEGSSLEMSQYVTDGNDAVQTQIVDHERKRQSPGQIYGNRPKRGHTFVGHQCPICNKVFVAPSKLARHINTHTGERPHTCWLCQKAFRQKSHLQQHIACVHHSEIVAQNAKD